MIKKRPHSLKTPKMPPRKKPARSQSKRTKKKQISFNNNKCKDFKEPHSAHTKSAKNVTTRKKVVCKKDPTMYKNTIRSLGLTSKEKSYIISSLQNKSSRYTKLKDLASKAKRENKIFSIFGTCNAVRKALVQRGWVEKIPPNRINMFRINSGKKNSKTDIHYELERLMLSNLVEKCNPNFVWRDTQQDYDTAIDMKNECKTIVNKLKADALWTTKQGLCTYMKINYWFYIEDVAEVCCPRSYNSYDTGEIEEFIADYRITACTSLIQWVISMLANNVTIFTETGTIPIKVITFALNRCKEYLLQKRNRDIDYPIKPVSTKQWNAFLKKYYRLITNKELFEADKENRLLLYIGYAQFILEKMYIYRPQVRCEGYQNIWIIKPGHWSRGRGIRMASKLGVITELLNKANAKYVVQKYIEKPLLIHETKFDIRQYYLVTNTYPLVIWMYKDCYLKFSSQKYNLDNYHESIHLTNNAVQKKYNNYAGRHPELPMNNMWELNMYKKYLSKIGGDGVWEHIIYPGMKKSIIGIMLSGQDSLPLCKNRFELYGCDFLLDEEYTPWLIEINSCPDLTNTTEVTAKICPAVVDDVIKVVLDHAIDPKAPTGMFECIYQQPMTVPRFSTSTELVVRGYPLPNDYFYKGNPSINQIKHFGDSSDENEDESSFNKLKSIYSDDAIQDQFCDMNFNDNKTGHKKQSGFTSDSENFDRNDSDIFPSAITDILRTKKKSLFQSNVLSNLNLFNAIFNQSLNQYPKKYKKYQKPSHRNMKDRKNSKSVTKSFDSSSGKIDNKLKDYVLQASSDILTFISEKEKVYNAM
ncbi:tubulin glycylase 3A [Papilio machaon]|uniref:tubulin glycylase 3A n=1 Tax=Papilio machaon TaxID=76193 RepID=UPI001E664FEB|nr:tubulin glycylase 3A [Papilio machaon]